MTGLGVRAKVCGNRHQGGFILTCKEIQMLHALNNNFESIQELRERGYGAADFNVKKAKVMFFPDEAEGFGDLVSYDTKEVYYREDTGNPIAIHGLRYNPIQYPEMIDKTRDMIERCNLDATGIKEKIAVSPNGGMCLVEYKLPAKEYTTPDGDTGNVKVMALSSFNGVWSFILSLGFHQSACLNSQIFIKNPASIYKARHTNKLDIDLGVAVLGEAANIIEDEIDLWHELYNTPSDGFNSNRTVLRAFADIANYKDDIDEISWRSYKDNTNNKAMVYLMDKYQTHYAPKMGHNMWAVYNTITDWSTHAPSRSKDNIALMQRRTTKASEVMENYLLAA